MLLPQPIQPNDNLKVLHKKTFEGFSGIIRSLKESKDSSDLSILHTLINDTIDGITKTEDTIYELYESARCWREYSLSCMDYADELYSMSNLILPEHVGSITYISIDNLEIILGHIGNSFAKTLGLEYRGFSNERSSYYFEIVDPKKWLLGKLKHGI